jgi:hypothetical protein
MLNYDIFLNISTYHVVTIISLFFLTFARLLGKDYFWVIDDLDGIAKFSERLDGRKQKVDSYEVVPGKTVKFLSFIPELGFPGCILRFLRLHIGKKFCVLGQNDKGHDVYGYKQDPVRHHLISLTVQTINLVLAYTFLSSILPEPIAFGAVLLYAVHPLTTQCVGWISGINYSLSLMFALALLNVSLLMPGLLIKLILVAALTFLSTITLYVGGLTCIVLAFLGCGWEAVVSGLVGVGMVVWKGLETKQFRTKAFKEQNMGATTEWNWRKPIVMMKTLWYYQRLIWLPIQMGLYHVWGYFYEAPMEKIDRMFWMGVATVVGSVFAFIHGTMAIKLGIVWFYAYFVIFSNFITAQQFVADRYVTIPALGICVILASLLYGTPFFWVLVGLYTMRTLLHLPTFKNELDFYWSNFNNFRKSEVSLGNLGVAYINQGMHGAAVDTWLLATKINPHYDVPWYNLYSVFKSNGRLKEAHGFLKNCLNAKVVHFEKRWTEEFVALESDMRTKGLLQAPPPQSFYEEAAKHYQAKNVDLEKQALEKFLESDTQGIIPEMIKQVKERLNEINSKNLCSNPVPKN